MPSRIASRPLRRRTLFAIAGAGGAGAVLSACGAEREDPSAELDAELLGATLAAELGVEAAYETAARQRLGGTAQVTVDELSERAARRVRRLREASDGTEAKPLAPLEREHALDAVGGALENAIGAYHDAVGRVSTEELRRLLLELGAADAAELAVIRSLLGEQPAPDAFVTGGDEPPLVAPEEGDAEPDGEDTGGDEPAEETGPAEEPQG